MRDRIEFLDFGKGFAILAIVVFHYLQPVVSGWLGSAIMVGGSGVHLFMLLSGFGLTLSSEAPSPAAFYRRRFARFLVPYYAFLVFVAVVNAVHTFYPGASLYTYLGHILLFKAFDPRIFDSLGFHLWFVSAIVPLYLAFPFLASALERFGPARFAATLFVISAAWWTGVAVLGVAEVGVLSKSAVQFLWEFGLGMALGAIYRRRGYEFWAQRRSVLAPVALGGLGLMAVMALKGGPVGRVLNDLAASVGFTALAAWAYLELRRSPRAVRAVCTLGVISLELYLVHPLVRDIIGSLWLPAAGLPWAWVVPLLALPCTVAVALAFNRVMRPLQAALSPRSPMPKVAPARAG